MEWEDRIRQEEEDSMTACTAAAERAGLTAAQAVECENGEYACDECPWVLGYCRHCKQLLKYSLPFITSNPIDGYDAEYCLYCDIWLISRCSDPTCEFCAGRPLKPSDVLKDQ